MIGSAIVSPKGKRYTVIREGVVGIREGETVVFVPANEPARGWARASRTGYVDEDDNVWDSEDKLIGTLVR